MATTSKKGKKKGKTLALSEFLKDAPSGGGGNGGMIMNWAEETDDSYINNSMSYQSGGQKPKVINLPTAPRAARQVDVDLSRVPENGPYTAFLGNLPYECDERILKDFFKDLQVVNVRLPTDNGRFKGFGYIQFADRSSLIEALKKSDETLQKRPIRVDVADNQNKDQGGNMSGFGSRNSRYGGFGSSSSGGGPDPTEGNWRTAQQEFQPPPPQRNSFRDNDRYDGGGRREYGSSGGYDDKRRGSGYSTYNRGQPRDDYNRREGNDYNSYDQRDRGSSGGGFNRQWSQEREGGYRRGGDDYNRGGSRDGGFSRGGGYSRDGPPQRYGSGSRDNYDQGGGRPGGDAVFEPPRERRQLKLQPRQKPVESAEASTRSSSIFGGAKPVNTADREREMEEKLQSLEKKVEVPAPTAKAPETRKNIFGSAKPVDTAAREREIEEKLSSKMQNVKFDSGRSRDKGGFESRDSRPMSGRGSTASSRHGDDDNDSLKGVSRTGSVTDSQVSSVASAAPPTAAASNKPEYKPAPTPSMNAWSKKLTPSDSLPDSSLNRDERVHGEREEAEGNDHGSFERTPEGAAADDRGAPKATNNRFPPGDGRESFEQQQGSGGGRNGGGGYISAARRQQQQDNYQSRDRIEGKSYSGHSRDGGRRGNENRRRGDGDSNSGNRGSYQQRRGGATSSRGGERGRDDRDYENFSTKSSDQNSRGGSKQQQRKKAPPMMKQLEPQPVDFVSSSKYSILAASDDSSESADDTTPAAPTTTGGEE